MPFLARAREGLAKDDIFVICDPALGRRVADDGGRLRHQGDLIIGIVGLLMIVVFGTWGALNASGGAAVAIGAFVIIGLIGLVCASFVALLIRKIVDSMAASRSGIQPGDVVVQQRHERAWRLCRIGMAIADNTAWAGGTVDPQRKVPTILWAGVGLALQADERERDIERARKHSGLTEIVDAAAATLADDVAALKLIERNLVRVVEVARAIDDRKATHSEAQRADQQRQREEDELRAKLVGSSARTGSQSPEEQADHVAALAVETEIVGDLLAELDSVLRGAGGGTSMI